MKKIFLFLLFATSCFSQFGHSGGGSLDLDTLLPIIADSSDWTDGSTVNAIKPRDGKTVEADSGKFGSLEVTGNTILDGNLTMVTTATEQVKLGTGSNALPELAGAGDTDTGIRFTGGNKMQLVQGGLNSHTFRPYRYTLTASDGDTLGISLDGTYIYFYGKGPFVFQPTETSYLKVGSTTCISWSTVALSPYTNDAYSLGSASTLYKNGYFSDGLWLGGKGQTATQYISKENTIAGADSSMMFRIGSDGNPYMRWAAADADSARLHVRGDSTEFYSKNALVLDAPVTLIGGSNVGVSKIDTVFTETFVPRWLKITSGAKSWYSPVYADTTGKW